MNTKKGESEQDAWREELSPEQQADLDVALQEIKAPVNLVSNELAEKQLERWKSQN